MSEEPTIELVWGIEAIAKVIQRTPRQTYHMLVSGYLPAKQVGNRWVAEKGKLLSFILAAAS
jgi:hypothetical protein